MSNQNHSDYGPYGDNLSFINERFNKPYVAYPSETNQYMKPSHETINDLDYLGLPERLENRASHINDYSKTLNYSPLTKESPLNNSLNKLYPSCLSETSQYVKPLYETINGLDYLDLHKRLENRAPYINDCSNTPNYSPLTIESPLNNSFTYGSFLLDYSFDCHTDICIKTSDSLLADLSDSLASLKSNWSSIVNRVDLFDQDFYKISIKEQSIFEEITSYASTSLEQLRQIELTLAESSLSELCTKEILEEVAFVEQQIKLANRLSKRIEASLKLCIQSFDKRIIYRKKTNIIFKNLDDEHIKIG